jgi:hypothetical protein
LPEQLLADPEVHDTPIRVWNTLPNLQALQPGLIDGDGWWKRIVNGTVTALIGVPNCLSRAEGTHRHESQLVAGSLDQRMALGGEANQSIQNFDSGSPSGRQSSLGLLIGEMTPVGAGPVALIRVALIQLSQLSGDDSGDSRRQPLRTHPNPGLEVAGAGLDDSAGFMAVGAHPVENCRLSVVKSTGM